MKNEVNRNIIAPIERVNCNRTGSSVLNFNMDILKAARVPGREAFIIGST